MCLCGDDDSTPFCENPIGTCEWPEDIDDSNLAITNFLAEARGLAQSGVMSFRDYLDLCSEFDPAVPDADSYSDGPEGI